MSSGEWARLMGSCGVILCALTILPLALREEVKEVEALLASKARESLVVLKKLCIHLWDKS
jgi:hypothetical protein